MNLQRIYGIILRNFYTFRRSYDRWFDAFYNPIIDLTIWGLTSSYIATTNPSLSNLTFMVISGISLWLIVYRTQYETNVALLEDTWSRNLVNLFVSPLKFSEWIIAVLSIGFLKSILSFLTATITAFILYKLHIFSYGFYLIPLIFSLIMTGWWTSFIIAGLIFRFGSKVSSFAWTLIFLLAPFSGIYYPISSLPKWAQGISSLLPTSYVFEEMRSIIYTGIFHTEKIVLSCILNMLYLLLSLVFLRWAYNRLLRNGLLKVF